MANSPASFRVGQFILPGNSEPLNLLSFLYNNLNLNLIILLGYLSIVLLIGLLPSLIHPSYGHLKSLRLMSIQMFFLPHDRLPRLSRKLAVLMLFFNCFFFFTSNFLSGTIKTRSTLVKTDEIIVSGLQMLNSEKNFAIDHHDDNVLRRLPTNSLLKKVSEKKHFVIDSKINSEIISQIFEQGVGSFYFLARDIALVWILCELAPYASSDNLVAFTTPKQYHEWLTVFYFRPSLDEQRKRFLRRRYEQRCF